MADQMKGFVMLNFTNTATSAQFSNVMKREGALRRSIFLLGSGLRSLFSWLWNFFAPATSSGACFNELDRIHQRSYPERFPII